MQDLGKQISSETTKLKGTNSFSIPCAMGNIVISRTY